MQFIYQPEYIGNEIKYACTEQKRSLPFAPFIQTLIDGVTRDQKYHFVKDVSRGVYTMKISRKDDHAKYKGKESEAGTSSSSITRYNKKQNLICINKHEVIFKCLHFQLC